jgi:hypothetical protein
MIQMWALGIGKVTIEFVLTMMALNSLCFR